jgi:riboflavin kinase/FMN adenylyltransferase
MRHERSLEGLALQGAWLTIGSFDGVHRGHQAILSDLVAGAHRQGVLAVALTFHPHPAVVLGKRERPFYLTTPEGQADQMRALGVDVLITHPFNSEVAGLSARQFLTTLKKHLKFTDLLVGHDFAMGHNRQGDVPALRQLGEEMDFSVQVHNPVQVEGVVVSSSRIRSALSEGEVGLAARLLGRPYRLDGPVTTGKGRGRGLGIPTANLAVSELRMIPGNGVYVCRAHVAGENWGAVTNVGVRPTFEGGAGRPVVEAHLLDFDEDLYDQTLELDFLARVRSEMRFSGPEALVAQIRADIDHARSLLAEFG